jgi:hypothetical protein
MTQLELEPVRFSNLKLMALSPAHYRAAADKETYAMERGRALHSLVLGGPRVIPYPGKTRQGKDWAAFQAANDDAQILTSGEYAKARGMADAVRANRHAMDLLEGQHEVEIDWHYLGRRCQSHIDVIGGGGRWVTELKSTVSSNPDRFAWQAQRMAYFGQLAFYMEALQQTNRSVPEDAYVVAVEAVPPFVVTVMRLTDKALEQGRKCMRLWMERLLGCEATGEWPGYVQGVVALDAPEAELELDFGGGGDDFDPSTGEVAA